MNLKASFFNKSIFKSDIKRFWWLALAETFLIMIVTVIPFYESLKRRVSFIGSSYYYEPRWLSGSIVILMMFAIGVSVLLFTYMHFTSSVSTFHSFPVKRGGIFSTKLISGAVLTLIPIIINTGLLIFIAVIPEFKEFVSVSVIFKWMFTGVVYTAVLFSLTTVVNMMTGNPIGTIVFTLGFALLPLIIISSFQSFFDMELYGYALNSADNILKRIYIDEKDLLNLSYFVIYAVLTIVFLVGAYILYNKRKLEAYGEVIAFSWLKPVFIGIISVLTSILSYFYFVGALGKSGLLWLLPFGVIGTVVSWMISKKSISLKGILKPVLIYLIAALFFVCVIHFDLTGFERRVPNFFDIESVSIVNDNRMTWHINGEIVEYWRKGEMDYSFTEDKDIVDVLDFHQYMIKKRNEDKIGERIIPIEYKLKNGKVLRRQYFIDYERDAEFLRPLYETEQIRGNNFPIINGAERDFVEVKITDRRFKNSTFTVLYPDNPDMQNLILALQKDLKNISYEDMTRKTGESLGISVSYIPKYESKRDIEELQKTRGQDNDFYSVYASYKNTIEFLDKMGYYDSLPKASDIESASVYTWENVPIKEDMVYSYAQPTYPQKEEEGEKITDSEKISNLYSLYDKMIREIKYSNYETCKNIRITYTLKNGHIFEVSCSYDEDKIPEEIIEYF